MKDKIYYLNLIADGDDGIKRCLNELSKLFPENNLFFILMAQFNRCLYNRRYNLMSNETIQMGINQVLHSLTQELNNLQERGLFNKSKINNINSDDQLDFMKNNNFPNFYSVEKRLDEICRDNIRSDFNIYSDASSWRDRIRKYKDSITDDKSYDVRRIEYNELMSNINSFFTLVENSEIIDSVLFISNVRKLLSQRIPTWDNILEAYRLVCGRGFVNEWVEKQINNRPNDVTVNIKITSMIEDFLATL